MKLTIDQLKNYLGTGLKCHSPSIDGDYRRDANVPVTFDVYGLTDHYPMIDCSVLQTDCEYEDLKPICYRLSDLDKFIPELGFVPIFELCKIATIQIWFTPVEPISQPEILSENESAGVICWNETERVSFTCDKNDRRFDFSLYVDGSEMMLNKWALFQKLFQWHFWPFGEEYFEAGLVIDKLKMTEK